jgi:hypothetical protein
LQHLALHPPNHSSSFVAPPPLRHGRTQARHSAWRRLFSAQHGAARPQREERSAEHKKHYAQAQRVSQTLEQLDTHRFELIGADACCCGSPDRGEIGIEKAVAELPYGQPCVLAMLEYELAVACNRECRVQLMGAAAKTGELLAGKNSIRRFGEPACCGILATASRIARTWARAASKPCDVSTTKSARGASPHPIFVSPERLRACQYARALDLGRRRHHHDGIHPLVSPGLEQERDIEDRKLLAARLGLREKLLLGGLHQRDTDFDLSCQPWREDRQRPVGPGSAGVAACRGSVTPPGGRPLRQPGKDDGVNVEHVFPRSWLPLRTMAPTRLGTSAIHVVG